MLGFRGNITIFHLQPGHVNWSGWQHCAQMCTEVTVGHFEQLFILLHYQIKPDFFEVWGLNRVDNDNSMAWDMIPCRGLKKEVSFTCKDWGILEGRGGILKPWIRGHYIASKSQNLLFLQHIRTTKKTRFSKHFRVTSKSPWKLSLKPLISDIFGTYVRTDINPITFWVDHFNTDLDLFFSENDFIQVNTTFGLHILNPALQLTQSKQCI
jgi:hypothetical protein